MNTNWPDELRALDAVGPARDLWAEALARAGSAGPRSAWRRRAVIAIAVLAFVGAASAFAYRLLSPSPGFTAGLSGLESLPTVPWPSSMPTGGVPMDARATGLTTDQALHSLRLVQSGLSFEHRSVDLYAFPGRDGSACVFVVPEVGGICLGRGDAARAHEGIAWVDWPGDGPPGPSGPLCVFGLVADSVRSFELDLGGREQSVPIVDNSFYVAFDSVSGSESVGLTITYDDGTTRTWHQGNPYADFGPTGAGGPH
jgi:hypothetical protein